MGWGEAYEDMGTGTKKGYKNDIRFVSFIGNDGVHSGIRKSITF